MFCSLIHIPAPYRYQYEATWRIIRFAAYIPIFLVFCTNISNPNSAWTFIDKIHSIIKFIGIRMKTRLLLKKFKWICFWQFFIFVAITIVSHNLCAFDRNLKPYLIILFKHTYKSAAIMHALFYMKLFQFILISFNETIKSHLSN